MNRCFNARLLLVVIVVLLANGISEGKTTHPKTVVDYFLLLPQKGFFEIELAERQRFVRTNKHNRDVIDVKNDYLRMQGDGAQGTIQVALFRYRGQVLVAVYNEFEEGKLNLLRYGNGQWRDVTKAMLPVAFNRRCTYTLPRYGTTIRVTRGNGFDYEGDGKKLYDLVWTKGRFVVRHS